MRSAWFSSIVVVAVLGLSASGAHAQDVTLADSVPWPTSQTQTIIYGMAPDGTFWLTYQDYPYGTIAQFDHLDEEGNDLGDGFTIPANGWLPTAIDYYNGRLFVAVSDYVSVLTVESDDTFHNLLNSDYDTHERVSGVRSLEIDSGGTGLLTARNIALLDFNNTSSPNPFYPQSYWGKGINTGGSAWEGCVFSDGPATAGLPANCGERPAQGGSEVGGLDGFGDTALRFNGAIYILERGTDEVTILDPTTRQPVAEWGVHGSGPGALSRVYDIAYHAPSDTFLISDQDNRRISQYEPGGAWIRSFGWGVRTGTDQFEVCDPSTSCQTTPSASPRSYYTRLWVGPDGRAYAVDPLSGTLEVFSFGASGEPSDPTDPTDPADPTDPTDPADPTDPTGPGNPSGPTTPATPAAPRKVTLAANPVRVKEGRKTTLTAKLSPCVGDAANRALFQRKDGRDWDNLGSKSVDGHCKAKMKKRIAGKTKFQAVAIDAAGNRAATSHTVTVKLK